MKVLISKKLFALLITAAFFITTAPAQTTTALDDYILDKMKNHHLSGVCIAVIKDGKIALTKGYGLANIDKDIPFTSNSIQMTASISKSVTATAIMKLWEDSLFQLDDPVNDYLPFPVTNPFYPGTPITFRMLLSHTASLNRSDVLINGVLKQIKVAPGTAEELGSFLQNLLVPGGNLYIDSISYYHFEPGTQYGYSNFGYALLGYLVEQISEMPFNEYCNQNIFQPLCMSNTVWYFSELDTNIVARPYFVNGSGNGTSFIDRNLYELPDYPSHVLNSTVVDFSKFTLMHLNYGILDGVRIIDSTTEAMMRNIEFIKENLALMHDHQPFNAQIAQCFGWEHVITGSFYNEEIFTIGGDGPGIITQSSFSPGENTVVNVFANIGNAPEQLEGVGEIYFELELSVTDTISTTGSPDLNCSYVFNPCQQNADYWKNNSSKWALSAEKMKLGTKHYYSKNQTLDLLNKPVNGDASISLAKSLIAAKLNIAQGSELSPIVLTYNAAMNLIGDKRVPYDNPVSFTSATGIQMLALATTLDSYNAGNLNTAACSGYPSSITRSSSSREIDKTATLYSLSVFPNPASGNVTISFTVPDKEKISIAIYDVHGRFVKKLNNDVSQNGSHNLTWNTTNMNAGVYILKLQSGNFIQTKKLVIVK